MGRSNRAVFFDRDGVLNASVTREGKPHTPASVAEVVVAEDVPEALTTLKRLGFLLSCCANLTLDCVEVCYDAADEVRGANQNSGCWWTQPTALTWISPKALW